MSQVQITNVHEFYTMRKDIGVAIVLVIALALGIILRLQTSSRMTVFSDQATSFSIAYPATWGASESLTDALIKVQDPETNSPFKTTLRVESREIDSTNPPTLQELVDRRVVTNGTLTGYHFLSSDSATVGGAKALKQEFAYVVQPIDQPRRASLPVVVRAVEYIVLAKSNVFYITLAAPSTEFTGVSTQMDQIISSVQVQ